MHAHLHANICFGHLPVYMLWNAVGLCVFSVLPSRGVLFLQMKCLTQKFITSLSLRGSYKEREKEYHKILLAEMGKPDFANKNVSLDSR